MTNAVTTPRTASPEHEPASLTRRPRPSGRGARSIWLDRLVLFGTIAFLPRMDAISLGGDPEKESTLSLAWVVFAFLGGYVLLRRPSLRLVFHPVFITAAAFMGVCAAIELLMPSPDLDDLKRFAQTAIASVLLASICRDRKALGAALLGVVVGSLWLSFDLYRSSYDVLSQAEATTFREASKVRGEAFEEFDLQVNLNRLGFLCAAGVAVSLAMSLSSPRLLWRLGFLGASAVCLLGSFLPQSRSAVLAAVASSGIILLTYRRQSLRSIFVLLALGLAAWLTVPAVVFSRFEDPGVTASGKTRDSRRRVYLTILEAMPDYWLTGVGAGNYQSTWAVEKGISKGTRTLGAHSTFLQIWINWGLAGLALFLLLVWQAGRCLPRHCAADPLALALLGLAIAVLVRLLFTHNFYNKEFAIALGLFIAARCFIWPSGQAGAHPAIPTERTGSA